MSALPYLVAFASLFSTDPVANAPIVVAVEDAAAPWSQKDGSGYANDVVMEAFKAAGVETKLLVVPYARAKHMAIEGEVVACFSMSPDPAFRESIVLSDKPLFSLHSDYFQNLKKPLRISSENEFTPGMVIGIVIDYEYPESVLELKKRGVVLDATKDEETNLHKLAVGRLDAVLINHNDQRSASLLIASAGATGAVGFAFRSGDLDAYIGFSKKHPQGDFARKAFNQGFESIQKNGAMLRINAKWNPTSHGDAVSSKPVETPSSK